MTAQQYKDEHKKLMDQWENECRKWFAEETDSHSALLNANTNFFEDGIIDPDMWFSNEYIRPLFILKEVHDTDEQKHLRINFVAMKENPNCDIWNRKGMWHALGTLAKGIIEHLEGNAIPMYEELYSDSIEEYRKTLRKIAIVNIKKAPGGGNTETAESQQTKHFTCHACRFKDNLRKQILLTNPTVIICCSPDVAACFDIVDNKLYGIPVAVGLHPATNANRRRERFYTETIKQVKELLTK